VANRLAKRLVIIVSVGLAGLLLYGLAIEPYWIEVRRVEVRDPFWGRALAGLKVVQVSDLHMRCIGRREAEVLRLVENLKPDLLLLTGDYVASGGDYGAALEFLSRLRARLGVWAVLGDVDYCSSRQTCLFCHEPGDKGPTHRHQVRFLTNQRVLLRPEGVDFYLAGIDPNNRYGKDKFRFDRPALVLIHDPMLYDKVQTDEPLLCLAGDTHGGQVWMPEALWRSLNRPARYKEGLYRRGNRMLYVNRGVGTRHLPLRLGERPEITVFSFSR